MFVKVWIADENEPTEWKAIPGYIGEKDGKIYYYRNYYNKESSSFERCEHDPTTDDYTK